MSDSNKAWGRRLIICCDGTWQTSVSDKENIPSNVTKLVRLIRNFGTDKEDPNKKWHQIVYYDSGIGTGNLSGVESARQGGTGAGLMENVIEAYNFIVSNYEPGDEIFCFGFSRGAFTARAVSGLITDIGIIKPLDMQFFPRIYRAYMNYGAREDVDDPDHEGEKITQSDYDIRHDKNKGFRQSKYWDALLKTKEPTFFKGPPSDETRKIKVVGVWDTVGSLGIADVAGANLGKLRKKYGFHNTKLSRRVEHAYHAIALDERRPAFRPTLWYIDPETDSKSELKQVWFPGVHINCGGGSSDGFLEMEGDMENISVATFTWMLQCIAPYLDIDQDAFTAYLKQYEAWIKKLRNECYYIHASRQSLFTKLRNKLPNIPLIGSEPDPLADPPREETSHKHEFDFGWGVGPMQDSYTLLYKGNGSPRARQPGHEEMEIEGQWVPIKGILTGKQARPTGYKTHEYIHPLVNYRRTLLKKWDLLDEYSQKNHPLFGWERKIRTEKDGSQRYWWYKPKGGEADRLPEWCILPHTKTEMNYERTWYNAAQGMNLLVGQNEENPKHAPGYLEKLDKDIKFNPDKMNDYEL